MKWPLKCRGVKHITPGPRPAPRIYCGPWDDLAKSKKSPHPNRKRNFFLNNIEFVKTFMLKAAKTECLEKQQAFANTHLKRNTPVDEISDILVDSGSQNKMGRLEASLKIA